MKPFLFLAILTLFHSVWAAADFNLPLSGTIDSFDPRYVILRNESQQFLIQSQAFLPSQWRLLQRPEHTVSVRVPASLVSVRDVGAKKAFRPYLRK